MNLILTLTLTLLISGVVHAQNAPGYSDFCQELTQNVVSRCAQLIESAKALAVTDVDQVRRMQISKATNNSDGLNDAGAAQAYASRGVLQRLQAAKAQCDDMAKGGERADWQRQRAAEDGECIQVCNAAEEQQAKVNRYGVGRINLMRNNCMASIRNLERPLEEMIASLRSSANGGRAITSASGAAPIRGVNCDTYGECANRFRPSENLEDRRDYPNGVKTSPGKIEFWGAEPGLVGGS